MTNNIWTLTKHVAGSVNKGAGALDRAIYGPVQPTPTPPPPKHNYFVEIGSLILGLVIFLIWFFTWANRWENFKSKVGNKLWG